MQAVKPMNTPGSHFDAGCNWDGLRGAGCDCYGVELGITKRYTPPLPGVSKTGHTQ